MAGCDDFDDDSSASSNATVCTTVGTTWWSQRVGIQTSRFHVELTVTPSRANMDAVVGLSPEAATSWSSLAAILRFNDQGKIDARAGSVYRADTVTPYAAGTTYYVRFDVDIATRTYTVAVGTQRGSYPTVIGRDYPFRTEHASATHLAHVAGYVDPTIGGTVSVCDVSVVAAPASGCTTSAVAGGFANQAIQSSSTASIITFEARPSAANMDGVIGVANGSADSFSDLAAAIRFAANGMIEARDGDAYRADVAVPYLAGQLFDVQLVVDLPSKTYSVYLRNYPDGVESTLLASGYRFRTQQASVASLDHVATVVDSTTGQLETCQLRGGPHPRVLSVRDGIFDVQPLADGSAVISDGARTTKLDANNVPRGSIAAGGKVTADAAGNIYIASVANNALTVRAYTAALAPRWTQSYATEDTAAGDIVVNTDGHLVVALGRSEGGTRFTPAHVALIDAYGPLRAMSNLFAGSTAISLSPNHFAVAMALANGVEVQVWRYGDPPALVRTRQLIGDFNITHISIATDDTVVFGGYLAAPMDFGDCAIAPFSGTEVYWNAYVTTLRSDLMTQFCRRLTSEVTGIAHDASRIAVAYQTWTQLPHVETLVYDHSGTAIGGTTEDAFLGNFGDPGGIALASGGRLYLNVRASLEGPFDRRWPFLVTLR